MICRTPQQIFERHLELRVTGNFERDLIENYSPDVILFCEQGTLYGRQAIWDSATALMLQLPHASFQFKVKAVVENYAFLIWNARSDTFEVTDGVDSFVFKDNMIAVQTIFYRLKQSPSVQ